MKVGILTFHRPINYGACLQAYALNKKLSEFCECEIIDYICPLFRKQYRVINTSSFKQIVRSVIVLPHTLIVKNKFKKFLKKNAVLSDKVTRSGIDSVDKKYDRFVVGSDQVWNFRGTDFDKTYFLDFVKEKERKYSYAASFGISEIPEEYVGEYAELLKSFNTLSVREENGLSILREQLGLSGIISPDPTLLLDKKEWLSVAGKEEKPDKKYILIYMLLSSEKLLGCAEAYAEKYGYEIRMIGTAVRKKRGIKYMQNVGPCDFINLFANCEAVFTNSFHGTAFSVNFNKELYSFPPDGLDTNNRITDFLEKTGLSDRIITDETVSLPEKKIDYRAVNVILSEMKTEAVGYLRTLANE